VHAILRMLLRSEVVSAEEVGRQAAAKRIPKRFAACLSHLLERLHQLAPGRYLVSHAGGSPDVCIYQSTMPPTGKVQESPFPLPGNPRLEMRKVSQSFPFRNLGKRCPLAVLILRIAAQQTV